MLVFCLIEILIPLTGVSVTVGRMIVLVPRIAILSAISSPVKPMCDGTHMSSNDFFLMNLIGLECSGLFHLTGKDFGVPGGH